MEKDIRFIARFYREGRMNTSQAWKKLGIQPRRRKSLLVYRITTVAATVCLATGLSWWWMSSRQDWITIAAPQNEIKEITLPDDTRITLAGNAMLRYNRPAYGKEDRKVELTGKAFFSVSHREDCPFKVNTKLADVQVLGTRFQVIARADSTSATVESGKVRFNTLSEKEAILTRGMRAATYPDGGMRVSEAANPNIFAWKTYEFTYNDTPLSTVVKELEEVYHVPIGNLPDRELRLTVSFRQNTIDEILNVINQTLNIDLTKQ